MKIVVALLSSVVFLCAAGEKRQMKDVFVNSCYDTAVNDKNSPFKTDDEKEHVKDYCKCVFDVTTEKMTLTELVKATTNDKSSEYKNFMQKMKPSIKACVFHFE